ncbi:polyhydroxyalkanoate synthase [Mesobacillus persicus]|uniref:Polyhydroxyalkanoate synthase n=2 Tax=Mesobacillus persicus TaxID=930146 RepID=A0A1H8CNU3_9BACI|nr:polyhydroxyalkanoate synthase [Mesobacillus persicus]
MAIESPVRIPALDYEKEMKRWSQVFKILSEDGPKIEHSPRQLVWRKNKTTLWYYAAEEKKYSTPLFFVYSLLNKPYILDISPETSVIAGLTKRGYDVYLLDWGTPGYEDSDISFDTYILDYLEKGVKRALRHSGEEEISVVGYCLGGTIASIFASITDLPIKNLIVATVPIDFSTGIGPEKWLEGMKNGQFEIDRLVDVYGTIPADYIYYGMKSLAPIYVSPYVGLMSRAHDSKYVERWRRMDKWLNDATPFTGAALKQMFNELYKENKLVKGELVIGGKKADLSKIDCPFFAVSSANDSLIAESQSLPIMDLVSSEDKTYKLVEAGHVSLALSGMFAPLVDEWLASRSTKVEDKTN